MEATRTRTPTAPPRPGASLRARIADRVAHYAGPLEQVTVDGEQVEPQTGGFYGGWITPKLVGPFKGSPGTGRW